MPLPDASPPPAAVQPPLRTRSPRAGRAPDRAAAAGWLWPAALAVGCGALVPAIHFGLLPWQVHRLTRDWVMHAAALTAATIVTAAVLGYRRSSADAQQRLRLRLGCAVPLSIALLHELGQWLWPAGARDAFDSVRDALLDVAGTAIGWWALRPPRHAPPV